MDVKITYNWLCEYLETDASAHEIQKYLSLCGPSVEKVEKKGDDWVFDIEVTSNRVDAASVFGIAQECQAILPRFGKKAKLKSNPLLDYPFIRLPKPPENKLKLNLQLDDQALASRLTGIILSNIRIEPSPDFIRQRLEACDIRSINNVVDVSNYIMLALGQPSHTFDYDTIKDKTMIIREARKGEKVTTLDKKEITLPGGDIVIEDGTGNLVDLAGIMGGLESEVTNKTKNVLLFIETYNKSKIRKTSMLTGQRTQAATYFEKGLDAERVEPAIVYGASLLEKYAGGHVASELYDIYQHPYKAKSIKVKESDIERITGIKIPSKDAASILRNLGFATNVKSDTLDVSIPSWRQYDVEIVEDIVEEVTRVYGYHNLPNTLQAPRYITTPTDIQDQFKTQQIIKIYLKHIGLNETMNYSMISDIQLERFGIRPQDCLMLQNTISEDIKYMRPSLIPSLVKNIKDNAGKRKIIRLFEIAKTYTPRKGDLPQETYHLTIATNTTYADIKGIVEGLLLELTIHTYNVEPKKAQYLYDIVSAEIESNGQSISKVGQLESKIQFAHELPGPIYIADFEISNLIKAATNAPNYKPTNQYATIKLDLTVHIKADLPYGTIVKKALATSRLLEKVEYVGLYKDKLTLRFYFTSTTKNLTEAEAKAELEKIKSKL